MITLLDIVLLAVMLISALLAADRGVIRMILGVFCCAVAISATLYVVLSSMQYFQHNTFLLLTTALVVFFGALGVVVILVGRASRRILNTRIGSLDCTVGFVFGLLRGLLIVVVAHLLFTWLVPEGAQPDWVKHARSQTALHATGRWFLSLIPDTGSKSILEEANSAVAVAQWIVSAVIDGLVLSPIVDTIALVRRLARPEPLGNIA